jgi:hypothetical protein
MVLQCKGSRRHSFRVKVRTTEKEEEVEISVVVRLLTDVRVRRVEAHRYLCGQEDHSHWRSMIHQDQTAEFSRSSGRRG